MNSTITNLLTILGVLVASLALFWVGFRVPPRIKRPRVNAAEDVEKRALPGGLPEPLQRYLDVSGLKTVPASLAGWGRGRIVANRNLKTGPLWTPLRWSLLAQSNLGFVSKTDVTWFGYTLLRGGDELLPDRGRFAMGGKVLDNDIIRRSEQTMFWLYQLWMAPAMLTEDGRLHWETVDDDTVKMVAPVGDEEISFTLRFEPVSGRLARVETLRAASRDGANIPFSVRFSGERNFYGVGSLPLRMTAAWEDEEYVSYDLFGVFYDAEVGEEIQQGLNDGKILSRVSPEAEKPEGEENAGAEIEGGGVSAGEEEKNAE